MKFGRHSARSMLVVGWGSVIALAATACLVAHLYLQERATAATADAVGLADRAAAAAEAAFNRSFIGLDLMLTQALRLAPGPDADERLEELRRSNLMLQGLHLLQPDGAVIASTGGLDTLRAQPAAAGWLDEVGRTPPRQMVVSDAVANLAASERVLLLARRLTTPHGDRVAVAEVPVSVVKALLNPMPVPGLTLTLERDDGRLVLATLSNGAPRTATRPELPPLPATAQAAAQEPTTWRPGRVDGRPAMVGARATVYRGLWLSGGVDQAVALASFEARVREVWIAVGGLVLLLCAGGGAAHVFIVRAARAQALLDQALASMADGFLLCDSHDRVVVWNRRYLELFPWLTPVLAPGLPFRQLAEHAARTMPVASPIDREAWVEARLASRRTADRIWEQDLANGVSVQALEARTPDGAIVSVYRDLTAHERRLAEARAAAEAANEAKTRFLATMSHEIRTPLNAIIGTNELLRRSSLDAQQRRLAELMHRSGQHLLALVNDVLDLSQIESGQMVIEARRFDPLAVIDEVVDVMRPRAAERGLSLIAHCAPDLPAAVLGDAVRIRQILFNLIGNAIKFTERGEVAVSLSLADPADAQRGLHVRVTDTGPGIAEADLPRLFQRFTQFGDPKQRRPGGSGLGLAITHEILTLMGGRIEVQSTPGQGTRFDLHLPLPPAAEEPALELSGECPARARLRVLVAEDNAVNQLVIQALLEHMGHDVTIADDGTQAVACALQQPFDVVLMDMQMPDTDGLAATRRIRAAEGAGRRVPIVAMTANATPGDREACLAAGMDEFVSKPIDSSRLEQALYALRRDAPVAAPESALA